MLNEIKRLQLKLESLDKEHQGYLHLKDENFTLQSQVISHNCYYWLLLHQFPKQIEKLEKKLKLTENMLALRNAKEVVCMYVCMYYNELIDTSTLGSVQHVILLYNTRLIL